MACFNSVIVHLRLRMYGKYQTTIIMTFKALKIWKIISLKSVVWVVSYLKSALVQEMAWYRYVAKPFLEVRLTMTGLKCIYAVLCLNGLIIQYCDLPISYYTW